MGESNRPAVSIALKKVGTKDRVYVLAGWPREDGKITSLVLDKRVKGMKLLMDDGEVIEVTRDAAGKLSHYVDAFFNEPGKPAAKAAKVEPTLPVDDEW
jgi:hypothetical protein